MAYVNPEVQQPAVQPERERLPQPPPTGEEPLPPEQAAPRRRGDRGVNRVGMAGVEMGPSGRQEITLGGRRYIRDGGWWVDAEALGPYNDDPDSAPPEVVEANRMKYAQGLNRSRQEKVANWNDTQGYGGKGWDAEAADVGFQGSGRGGWRELRAQAVKALMGAGVTDENILHYVWITNPTNVMEVLKQHGLSIPGMKPAGGPPATDPPQPSPPDTLPPKPTDRQGPIFSNPAQDPANQRVQPRLQPMAPPVPKLPPAFSPPAAPAPTLPQAPAPKLSTSALPQQPKQFQIPGAQSGGLGLPKLKGLLG